MSRLCWVKRNQSWEWSIACPRMISGREFHWFFFSKVLTLNLHEKKPWNFLLAIIPRHATTSILAIPCFQDYAILTLLETCLSVFLNLVTVWTCLTSRSVCTGLALAKNASFYWLRYHPMKVHGFFYETHLANRFGFFCVFWDW